jgi:hypothetical protein
MRVALALLAALLAGCSSSGIKRSVDPELGIVCYLYGDSISCLPIPEEEDELDLYDRAVTRAALEVRAGDRGAPSFRCSIWHEPRIRCEARNVWPTVPAWIVYRPGTSHGPTDVADTDRGLLVYITLPREAFARFEMCYATIESSENCLAALGGYFSGRLRMRPLEEGRS